MGKGHNSGRTGGLSLERTFLILEGQYHFHQERDWRYLDERNSFAAACAREAARAIQAATRKLAEQFGAQPPQWCEEEEYATA